MNREHVPQIKVVTENEDRKVDFSNYKDLLPIDKAEDQASTKNPKRKWKGPEDVTNEDDLGSYIG